MKANEWHWARLKKDIEMFDGEVLYCMNEATPFTLVSGTVVWAYQDVDNLYTRNPVETTIKITVSNSLLERNEFAYQYIYDTDYNDLLESLE